MSFGNYYVLLHLFFFISLKVNIGIKHPDQVVETASMSSVEPADVWYELEIPDTSIDTGKLSALQLESIVYASQQHEHFLPDGTRAGFLIGTVERILFVD